MTRAVAYTRYSSDNQRQESTEAQIYAIKNYCDLNDIELIKTYSDEEVSATSDDREEFQRMISESAALDYELVVVHKLDRFARNRYDSAIYRKSLSEQNKRVVSVLENIDDSPEGGILEALIEGMAEYYSKNLAREVKKGMELNARKGLHTGGKPLYGYDVHNMKLIINEDESLVVKGIFRDYLSGSGLREIAVSLEDKGIRNKFNRYFSHTSLHYLLRNKRYIGIYEYQPTPKGRKRSKYYRDENLITIENNHEPIIDNSTFYAVQEMLGAVRPRKKRSKNYFLTGKIVCGHCGSSFHGGGWDGKRFVYICSNSRKNCPSKKVNADKLENYVIDAIHNEYLTSDRIEKIAQQSVDIVNEYINDSRKEAVKVKKELDEISNKINQLFDNYLDIGMDADLFKEQSNRLKDRRDTLKSRVASIESNSTAIDTRLISEILNKMKAIDMNSDEKDINTLLKSFVRNIEITRDEIIINLYNLGEAVGGKVSTASPAPKASHQSTGLMSFFLYYKITTVY